MKITSVLILGIILFFCSCQKEVSEPLPVPVITPTTPNNNDSTTLIRYADLDTAQSVGLDTLAVGTYTYDNSKRVIKVNYKEYSSGIPDDQFETILYYNLSDTLPFKKIETYSILPSGTISGLSTGYFKYSNGKLVNDSIIQFMGETTSRTYAYGNDKIMETSHDNSNSYITNTSIYLTKMNGCTVRQIDTSSAGNFYGDFKFLYDNKNNPFYGIPQPFLERSAPYYEMETYSNEMGYEKNNVLQIDEQEGPYEFHYKYFYEYNLHNYPSVARVFDQVEPTNYFKRVFVYTRL